MKTSALWKCTVGVLVFGFPDVNKSLVSFSDSVDFWLVFQVNLWVLFACVSRIG